MSKPALWLTAFPKQVQPVAVKAPKRIRPVSKRLQKVNAAYREKARAFVVAAVSRGERCPVVTTIPELRNYSATLSEIHHMRGRGYGGRGPLLMDERFWLAVSSRGHAWIDANRGLARQRGWLCEKGSWNKPVTL